MSKRSCAATLIGLTMTLTAYAADGRELLSGPVAAEVIQVIDGDTFEARARIWLGQEISVRIRLDGIDTPEIRARCAREARLAERAKGFTAAHLRQAVDGLVTLEDIHYGKYAGRVLAKVRLADGSDLGKALINAGLARAYDGGARPDWCGEANRAAG